MQKLPCYALFILSVTSCSAMTDASVSLPGTYVATAFQVTPSGQATINVLAAGGTLTIVIAADNSTTGTLSIPASLNGGVPLIESMAGTASLNGSSVHFQQGADTFVRDLTWTISTNLTVSGQVAGSASYTITLSRQ